MNMTSSELNKKNYKALCKICKDMNIKVKKRKKHELIKEILSVEKASMQKNKKNNKKILPKKRKRSDIADLDNDKHTEANIYSSNGNNVENGESIGIEWINKKDWTKSSLNKLNSHQITEMCNKLNIKNGNNKKDRIELLLQHKIKKNAKQTRAAKNSAVIHDTTGINLSGMYFLSFCIFFGFLTNYNVCKNIF